jgi:sporulation protein YqfC
LRKEKKNKIKFGEKAAESLEMPKEMFGMPKIVIYGRREISVENFDSILEYGDIKIRLKTKTYHLTIVGSQLGIKNISPDIIRIYGEIANIEFT